MNENKQNNEMKELIKIFLKPLEIGCKAFILGIQFLSIPKDDYESLKEINKKIKEYYNNGKKRF